MSNRVAIRLGIRLEICFSKSTKMITFGNRRGMETTYITGQAMSTSEYNCLINQNICPECRGELKDGGGGCKMCFNCFFSPCG